MKLAESQNTSEYRGLKGTPVSKEVFRVFKSFGVLRAFELLNGLCGVKGLQGLPARRGLKGFQKT